MEIFLSLKLFCVVNENFRNSTKVVSNINFQKINPSLRIVFKRTDSFLRFKKLESLDSQ
ncbi:hypothetical protein LEP1GSC040_3012 [Leptospira santarosai str. 2000030832]|nr:hypothetical protein LEP1GSC040_3012 [Leptospira santarosai str. 2000030832]